MYACAHIIVTGVVQGVGFRYFALKHAQALGLTGYAKNMYNGNVETEVEGPRQFIEDYIKRMFIGPRFSDVTNVKVDWVKYDNKYKNFTITG